MPEHIGLEEAVILTTGVTVPVTIRVIVFEVAVVGLAQAKLEVITQLTRSPLTNAAFEYIALFVPSGVPFKYH